MVQILKQRKPKQAFDMGKSPIPKVFRSMWIPTIIAMVITGTIIVFDSMFVSMGFGPWAPFTMTGKLNMSSNAYASLGAAGISSVQPYVLLIAAAGILVGAGSAMKMSKAKAIGDEAAYQKAMNSFLPQNVYLGAFVGIILILLAKPLIYLGSGAQPFYAENWLNNPTFQNWHSGSEGWDAFFKAGAFERMVNDLTGSGFADVNAFAVQWSNNGWAQITGLDLNGLNPDSYIYGVIDEFMGKPLDAATAEQLAAVVLAETPMAAGHLLQQATFYLQIQALGSIPFMIFASIIFIMRVEGKASHTIMFNFVGLIVNIGLDFILVNVMGGNMVGAVIATVIAQIVGAWIAIRTMKRELDKPPTKIDWLNGKETLFETMKEGVSTFALNLANILLLWGTVLSIGISTWNSWTDYSVSTSGFQAFFSIFTLFTQMAIATTVTMAPIVTYNHAAGNFERVDEIRKLSFRIMLGYTAFVSALGLLLPNMLSIVSSKDPAATSFIIQLSLMTFWANALTLMSANWLQARGHNKWAYIGSFMKPILIAPVTIAIGVGFAGGGPGFGTMPFFNGSPFNPESVGINVAMFWAGPAIDLLTISVMFVPLRKDFALLKDERKGISSTNKDIDTLRKNLKDSWSKLALEMEELHKKPKHEDYKKAELVNYAHWLGMEGISKNTKPILVDMIKKKEKDSSIEDVNIAREKFWANYAKRFKK